MSDANDRFEVEKILERKLVENNEVSNYTFYNFDHKFNIFFKMCLVSLFVEMEKLPQTHLGATLQFGLL